MKRIIARSASSPVAAVKFKSANDPNDDDLGGLLAFQEEHPKIPCYCFSQTPRAYELSSGINVLPWREGLDLMRELGKKPTN